MRHVCRGLAFLAVAAAIASFCGCPFMPSQDDDDDGNHVVQFRARTSPANLIENLKAAYKERSLVEYESLLAMDFTFYFSQEDQGNPQIPDEWGRTEEIEAHSGMFDAEYVQTLTMELEYSQPVFDEEHFDGVDSLWVVEITNMDLALYGTPRSTPGEAPAWYKVEDGQVTMRFRKNAWTHSDGRPIWKIRDMEETTTSTP